MASRDAGYVSSLLLVRPRAVDACTADNCLMNSVICTCHCLYEAAFKYMFHLLFKMSC